MIDSFRGDYYFLSNFFEVPFIFEGKMYMNSESAFQAQKCRSEHSKANFRNLTAKNAKILGRQVLLRPDWEQVKDQMMLDILRVKFMNRHLAKMLLDTGDELLVEGNTWGDTYWGACNGRGRNQLGITLMKIREEIRNG
jgi:ribA/ribD-fused uncharacterized protein